MTLSLIKIQLPRNSRQFKKKEIEKLKEKYYEIDLLSGYLKCFYCCEHLIIRKSKNQVYYYCSSYIKNKDCLKYSINKKKLEQLVIDELNNFLPINLEKLDRKILSKYINMIYVIDKESIKIDFKNK